MNPWKIGTPKKRGWYLRDYRSCQLTTCPECPPFSVDLWEPSSDPYLKPGVWYVHDDKYGTNDANYQDLPWRKIT